MVRLSDDALVSNNQVTLVSAPISLWMGDCLQIDILMSVSYQLPTLTQGMIKWISAIGLSGSKVDVVIIAACLGGLAAQAD